MSPLNEQSWWEFGLWCMLVATFGSFIKSFCVDNIVSVKDIFKQVLMSVFIALIICLYGSYKIVDKRLQLIFAAFAGLVGMQGVFYITGKLGGFFNDIGYFLQGLQTEKDKKKTKPEKRVRKMPPVREQRKRKSPHE